MAQRKFNIKKNDKIMVVTGREKGKIGTVLRIIPEKERVIVEKLNIVKRHTRSGGKSAKGGIVEKEAPIHITNIMLVCGKCAEATRVGKKILEDGRKVRFCRKCGEIIDK